jgi:hypothetical protein
MNNKAVIESIIKYKMKKLLVLFLCLFWTNISFAQNRSPLERIISIKISNERLDNALKIIADAGNFSFSYNPKDFLVENKVSINAQNQSIREILLSIFGNNILLTNQKNYIILKKNDKKAQKYFFVMGYVSDGETGLKIEKASIYEPITLVSTVSNEYGYYRLKIPFGLNNVNLLVRKKSYQDERVLLKTKKDKTLNIKLLTIKTVSKIDTISRLFSLKKYTTLNINRLTIKTFPKIDTISRLFSLKIDSLPNKKLDSLPIILPNITKIEPIEIKDSIIVEASKPDSQSYWNSSKEKIYITQKRLVNWLISTKQKIHLDNIRDTIYRPVQVSILPFIGTNHYLSGNVINHFSFNVIGGYSLGVKTAEIGGILNAVRGKVNGVQVSGLINLVGQHMNGVQMASFLNLVGGNVSGVQISTWGNLNFGNTKGIQIAGFSNAIIKDFSGFQWAAYGNFILKDTKNAVQIAGFNNMVGGNAKGIQIAGFGNAVIGNLHGFQWGNVGNLVGGNGKGIQIAGLGNIVIKDFTGIQIASTGNFTTKNFKGIQVASAGNFVGGKFVGLQVSLLNYSKTFEKGIQFGLLNFSDENKGLPLGLLSFVKKGYKRFEVSADELSLFNLSFKTGVKYFYTILAYSYNFGLLNKAHYSVGYGIGTAHQLKPKLWINFDIVSSHVQQKNNGWTLNQLTKASLGVEYHRSKHFAFFIAPAFNFYAGDKIDSGKINYFKFNEKQGTFFEKKTTLSSWIGFQGGIRLFKNT